MIDENQMIRKLGDGASAQVFEAVDLQGENRYAAKVFFTEKGRQDAGHYFDREAYVHRKLSHQHIIGYQASQKNIVFKDKQGNEKPAAVVITELAPNGDLFNFVSKGRLPEQLVKYYGLQLIKGIHYMHTTGYAHRDLKLENILVDKDYNLKIADFGVSCSIMGKGNSGFCDNRVGTVGYTAPEMEAGFNYQPIMADLYAFAVILFCMYTGNKPFNQNNKSDPAFMCFVR